MNKTIEFHLSSADGRYLGDEELKAFEDYLSSHQLRLNIYTFLQEKSDNLILEVLREMTKSHRQVIQEHGDKCRRDMGYVLQFAAVSILRNDDAFFTEHLVLWMQNIMIALKKEQQSAQAYRLLQQSIQHHLSKEESAIVNHYLDLFIEALTVGAVA
jgi:hypothetical protein